MSAYDPCRADSDHEGKPESEYSHRPYRGPASSDGAAAMSRHEATRLARLLLASMADVQGPERRLEALDRLEPECSPQVRPVLVRAREIVRNGV